MVDLLLVIIAAVAIYRGWRSGLVKSAFSLIGFIGGGLLGLLAGNKYLTGMHNIFGKFALYILFIAIGSTLFEWVLSKFGQLFHNKFMFFPIKWIDSILGTLFEILKAAISLYLIFSLITAAHWIWPTKYINQSKIYEKAKSVVPGVLKNVTDKVKF